jgi:hypothetical protein
MERGHLEKNRTAISVSAYAPTRKSLLPLEHAKYKNRDWRFHARRITFVTPP